MSDDLPSRELPATTILLRKLSASFPVETFTKSLVEMTSASLVAMVLEGLIRVVMVVAGAGGVAAVELDELI
jgi:hypothetical protein